MHYARGREKRLLTGHFVLKEAKPQSFSCLNYRRRTCTSEIRFERVNGERALLGAGIM